MTISHATCQRLSKIMLRRNRWQASGTITLPLAYYNITPVDNVALDYPRYSWTQKLFTVTQASLTVGTDSNGVSQPAYQLSLQETDPSIFEWCVNSEVLLNDTNEGTTVITDELANTPNGLSQAGATVALCAPVTNLVAESGASTMVTTSVGISSPAILCTWTPPVTVQAMNNGGYTTGTPNEMVVNGGHYNVQVSVDSAVTWNAIATVSGDTTSFSIAGLSDGKIAYVRIQAAQENGLLSEWNQVGPVTVSDTTLNISATDVYYGTEGNLLSAVLATTIESGATAIANAAAAQAAANAAADSINVILTETILTPGQKTTLIAEVAALNAGQTGNDAQAVLVGISSTAYDTALSTLNTYLATLTSPVAWDVITNYTLITGTGAELGSYLQAAYIAQSTLLIDISNAINSAVVAGSSVNYLTNTDKITLIQQYNAELATKTSLDASALALSVPTTAYDSAVAAISTTLVSDGAPRACFINRFGLKLGTFG